MAAEDALPESMAIGLKQLALAGTWKVCDASPRHPTVAWEVGVWQNSAKWGMVAPLRLRNLWVATTYAAHHLLYDSPEDDTSNLLFVAPSGWKERRVYQSACQTLRLYRNGSYRIGIAGASFRRCMYTIPSKALRNWDSVNDRKSLGDFWKRQNTETNPVWFRDYS